MSQEFIEYWRIPQVTKEIHEMKKNKKAAVAKSPAVRHVVTMPLADYEQLKAKADKFDKLMEFLASKP